jgi:hypothetical protein
MQHVWMFLFVVVNKLAQGKERYTATDEIAVVVME